MYSSNQAPRPIRALILTGDLGDGHRQAARALAEACGDSDAVHVQTEVIDYLKEMYTMLHPIIRYGFLKGVEKAPSLYGFFYRRSKDKTGLSPISRSFLRLGSSKLQELIRSKQPDLLICTFPLAAAAVSELKAQGRITVPLVTVITDYADHSLWVQPSTDLYLVGSGVVGRALNKRGISAGRIRVTGIPIRPSFSGSLDRCSLREQLGVRQDRPLALVMGGGFGLMGEGVRRLIRSELLRDRVQLVFICGNNELAKQSLEEEAARVPSAHIQIKGFVDDIHRWMGAADLLITKPGGLTTSEAVAAKLPLLLYKPIPGQEEENAEVLMKAGIAVKADEELGLELQLLELIEAPKVLKEMRRQAARFRQPQPALHAWGAMLELIEVPYAEAVVAMTGAPVRDSVREAW